MYIFLFRSAIMSKQYGSEDFIASLVTKVKLQTFKVDGTSCLTFLAY
jgi:hypothetical protein